MAPFLDEPLIDDEEQHRRPRLRRDAAGPGHGRGPGARGDHPVRGGAASTGWPAASGPGRCWSPRSAAPPSSPTSSSCWPSRGSPVPVSVRRNLPLPGWVGPLDLVVAVSLSGRARGPLALAAEAARRGASLLTVGAADSPLADVCARARGRAHRRRPRAVLARARSLWSLLTPVLLAADALGLRRGGRAGALRHAPTGSTCRPRRCRPRSESFVNPAKILAIALADSDPGGAGRRAAERRRRRPGRLDAGAHRPHARDVRRAAGRRLADRGDFDGPFTAGGGRGAGQREPAADIFADPFLDGPAQPRLGLLMLRDAPVTPVDPGERGPGGLHRRRRADRLGRRRARRHLVAEPGHPLVRLAGQIAQTDFAATYLAIGLGLDPSMSPHVADLRDRTHR